MSDQDHLERHKSLQESQSMEDWFLDKIVSLIVGVAFLNFLLFVVIPWFINFIVRIIAKFF